jgi:hypothetical protein
MRLRTTLMGVSILIMPVIASADAMTTAPSQIEVRALEEFNRGQYALALPMLKQAVTLDKSEPDRVSSLEENIRVCERNLNAPPPAAVQALAAAQAPPASLSANRTPHPAPVAGQVQEMAIKDLGNFDYDADKGGNIPPDVTAMSGSKIRLSGYMIPMDQAESITEFALVPSLFSCCFGQPPQIQHTIVVHVPKGKAVSYYPDEISVEGTLKVDEKKEDGFIVSIFEVDTTSVKPAAK